MKTGRQKVSRLEEALGRVHCARGDDASPGQRWEIDTMRRIRAMGPLTDGQDFLSTFETFVWRLVPATMVLLVATGAWALQLDLTTEIETAALMDPIGFDFIQKLGIM